MESIRRLFLWLIVVGPLHMGEQLLFGVEEFHFLKRSLDPYYTLFAAENADRASVLLITIVGTLLSLAGYGLLAGGLPRLVAAGTFALLGASEVHHVIEAVARRGYDPGVVTSLPYAALGVLLLAAVRREFRRTRATAGFTQTESAPA